MNSEFHHLAIDILNFVESSLGLGISQALGSDLLWASDFILKTNWKNIKKIFCLTRIVLGSIKKLYMIFTITGV